MLTDKVRSLKTILTLDPQDTTTSDFICRLEAEVAALSYEIEAQRSPEKRLQSALSRKRAVDIEVEELQKSEEACREALQVSTQRLATAKAAQTEINAECTKLRLLDAAPPQVTVRSWLLSSPKSRGNLPRRPRSSP